MINGQAATHYDILGVTPEATLDEIKAAYRERIETFRQRLHTPEQPDPAELDALRQAIATLGDPQARAAYDAQLKSPATVAQAAGNAPPAPPAVPRAPAVAAADAEQGGEENFSFSGDGGEYFRIWIVNLLLSIVTLGIYSAWAKVRREQYFHRNLLLDGSGFDYHGQPIRILKGRIIALLLLIGLSLAKNAGPAAYGLALLLLVPVVPWLAVKAFRFRAHNTSYRGLRFSFHGTYGQAAKVFIGYGLLTLFTLFLAFPLFYRQLRKFVLDNTHFGATPLACAVGIGEIYGIFLLPVLAVVLLAASPPFLVIFSFMFIPALYLLILTVVVPYIQCRTANAVWSSTRLGPHAFVSRLPIGGYIGLTLVNWLGILVTLGLFIPWARVRVARFRAKYLALAVAGSLDDFVAAEATAAPAVGDQAAEMFDLDIGL
ncbi:MAG: DUF898 family protein [Azonexus sp.]|jgi:uncharacterized membrane protein YjgN (DUF898 family)|uniref:DUF898 family protein n=1 Tax=Azonexus sp. TaxID=1872668 RepID=UPI0028189B6F|nr:DUF898 family protein [Azonexus sp.]MDR0775057.1 DUF898 family protein [Azonexus sp.]